MSALVYLSATLINNQLSTLYRYLNFCKDPFTLNRVLDEYSQVTVKVNQANKFIKFVLGAVNFLAVPSVSLVLSIISTSYDGAVIKFCVFTGVTSFFALLVLTAAFMASVHYKGSVSTFR